MTDRHANRRAAEYRQRAYELAQRAANEPHADRKQHMLNLVEAYECTADELAPARARQATDALISHLRTRVFS